VSYERLLADVREGRVTSVPQALEVTPQQAARDELAAEAWKALVAEEKQKLLTRRRSFWARLVEWFTNFPKD
jgi:hypothetical protein